MQYIVGFITLLLSLSMFFIDRKSKFMLVLICSMCLNFASFPFVSFGIANKMVCISFFISELKNLKVIVNRIKGTPIRLAISIITLSCIVHVIVSPHAHNLVSIFGFIFGTLISKYFVIGYIFALYKKSYNHALYKVFYRCLIILTFFGILNYITKDSIALSLVGNNFGSELANFDRIRVVALFNYPFDYGYICIMSLLLTLYAQKRHLMIKSKLIVCYLCSIFGIVICGCRTVMVVAVLSFVMYYLLNYPLRKSILYIGLCVILGIGSYSVIPSIRDKVNTTLSAFTMEGTQEDTGSSLVGRIIQYDTALSYIQGHKLLGRGFRFFTKDLGYNSNGNGMYDLPPDARPLLGLEGAIMGIILEQGYFGVVCYLLFYIILIAFASKLLKKDKLSASFAMIILTTFVLYGNMTGELSSAIITFFLAGIFLHIATNDSNKAITSAGNNHSGIQKHIPAGNA